MMSAANITPISDLDVPWECWRGPNNLVYFVHSKCASRTYNLLMVRMGWEIVSTKDIDWATDNVFSYIRNPLIKHRKGIAEFFFYNKNLVSLSDDIINNPKWAEVVSNITYLDHHSASIFGMLGKNAERITWIPIDTDLDHKAHTFNFFDAHGVQVRDSIKNWFNSLPNSNTSTPIETKVFETLMALPIPPHVLRYLDYDTILYEHAKGVSSRKEMHA